MGEEPNGPSEGADARRAMARRKRGSSQDADRTTAVARHQRDNRTSGLSCQASSGSDHILETQTLRLCEPPCLRGYGIPATAAENSDNVDDPPPRCGVASTTSSSNSITTLGKWTHALCDRPKPVRLLPVHGNTCYTCNCTVRRMILLGGRPRHTTPLLFQGS